MSRRHQETPRPVKRPKSKRSNRTQPSGTAEMCNTVSFSPPEGPKPTTPGPHVPTFSTWQMSRWSPRTMPAQSHATTPHHPSLHTSAVPDRRVETAGRGTGAVSDRKGRLPRGLRRRETPPEPVTASGGGHRSPGVQGGAGPRRSPAASSSSAAAGPDPARPVQPPHSAPPPAWCPGASRYPRSRGAAPTAGSPRR